MAANNKTPVLVCVPGVMQGAWLFEPLKTALAPLEVVALTLPGVVPIDDPRPAQDSMLPDVALVEKTITDLLDQGRDVIVLGHSYGGTPAGAAVGRILTERPEKEAGKGRILWIIYSCSAVAFEGLSSLSCADKILEAAGIPHPGPPGDMPWWEEKDGYLIPNPSAGPIILNEAPDLDRWAKKLGKQSLACPVDPIREAAVGFSLVPSTFIKSLRDTVLPPFIQEALVQQAIQHCKEKGSLAPFSDSEVGRLEISTDHAPMLADLDEYKEVILKVVKRATSD